MTANRVKIDRAVVCLWIARIFEREMDAATIAAYLAGEAAPLLAYLAQCDELAPYVRRFEKTLESWSNCQSLEIDLAADFSSLFLGDAYSGAPPYASCYEIPYRLLGEPHDRMRHRLGLVGLEAQAAGAQEPLDHFATMLNYLAQIYERADSHPGGQAYPEGPEEFIRSELLSWFPKFQARTMSVPTASEAYKDLVGLTGAVLHQLANNPSCFDGANQSASA